MKSLVPILDILYTSSIRPNKRKEKRERGEGNKCFLRGVYLYTTTVLLYMMMVCFCFFSMMMIIMIRGVT
jgi:hypothetical protein